MSIRRRGAHRVAVLALLAGMALGLFHAVQIARGQWTDLEFIATACFVALCFNSLISYLHTEVGVPRSNTHAGRWLAALRVTVVVPAHNEDPQMLRALLESITVQTRLPERVHVVENGDPDHGYFPALRPVFDAWVASSCPPWVEAVYTFNPMAGKREAQAVGVAADPTADVYLTLDSDVKLAPRAIAAGLAPFQSGTVASVGGLLVGLNRDANLLTRLVEVPFVCAALNGRAAQSLLGSVSVNSGAIAFYWGDVIRRYLQHYLTHEIAGRRMATGDDAMLTRYAHLEGRTVFQIECWGYTLHPVRIAHLTKQRLRWWRSYWWTNDWLLRTFSPTRPLWWLTAFEYVQFVWMSAVMPLIFAIYPIRHGEMPWRALGWLVGISYLTTTRYLTLARPNESFLTHVGMWALAPVSALLNLYLGFVLSYAGLVTCLRDRWASRGGVEVVLRETTRAAKGARAAVAGRRRWIRETNVEVTELSTVLFSTVNNAARPASGGRMPGQ